MATTRTRSVIALVLALITLAVLAPITEQPDWTVAPCSLWTTGAAPIIPPYTRTDSCATDDEIISFTN